MGWCGATAAVLVLLFNSVALGQQQQYDANALFKTGSKVYPGCVQNFQFRGYFDQTTGLQIATPAMGQTVIAVAYITDLMVYNLAENMEDAMKDYCTVATPSTKLTTDIYFKMLYTGLAAPTKLCYPKIPMTPQLASKSYVCPSVCSHRDTNDAITSRDACRLGQNSLAGRAWDLLMGNKPMDSLILSQLVQSPILGPCLLQYFGQSKLKPNSTCLSVIGDLCYRGMCISKTARPRGFNNEVVRSGVPLTHCSVDTSTQLTQKPAQFRTPISAINASMCDACVLRSMVMTSPSNGTWAEAATIAAQVTAMRPACPSVYLGLTASDADWAAMVTDPLNKAHTIQKAVGLVGTANLQGLVFEFGPGASDSNADFFSQFLIDVRFRLVAQSLDSVLLGVMTYNRITTSFLRTATVAPFVDKFFDRNADIRSFTTPGDCDYNMRTRCTSTHNTVRDLSEYLLSQGVAPAKLAVGVSLYASMAVTGAAGSSACNVVGGGESVQGRIPVDYITNSYPLSSQPVCSTIDPTTALCSFSATVGSENCLWRTMTEAHVGYRVGQIMTKYPSSDLFVSDVSVSRNGYWLGVIKQAVTSNLPPENNKAALAGGPYYYVGNGPRVTCPGILNYVGDYIVTSEQYENTVKLPLLGGYLALDGFTCSPGTAQGPTTCAQIPAFAVDMISLQTVSTASNTRSVLYDPVNYCFVVPGSQQLCEFTAKDGSSVNVYQLGTAFTDVPVERDQYWLGLSRYVTIVDEWSTVIEAIPVDYKCVSFDVSSIPDCLQVVCGGDQLCRQMAAGPCSMDITTRVAILGLQQQFYAVNEVYQLMVKELNQYNAGTINPFTSQPNAQSKFWGLLAGGTALILASKNAHDISVLQEAMKQVQGLLTTQSNMLDVHDRLLKNLQSQLVSHDQQLITVQSQIGGQQTQLNGLNQALNATNSYVNQLVQATAANADMSNNLQRQINSQQSIIDLINSKVGVNSRAISHNADQIMKLGTVLANLSIALDNNIKAVNGRVTLLEDEVNDRFSYVASQLSKLRQQQAADVAALTYNINLQNAAMLYYQQLNSFAVMLAHNALKLTAMVEAYRTCFRSLASGYLQGCPVNQQFLKDKPFFANFRSVQGIVYRPDLGVAAVLYRIPKTYRDFASYAVSAKPLKINGEWYVPRSDDVEMLGDGVFYSTLQCDNNICLPPTVHPTWADCMAAITVQTVLQIQQYCRLIKCAADHCSDIVTSPIQYTGTVTLPQRSVGDFTFYNGVEPVSNVPQVVVPPISIVPIKTGATLTDITPAVAQVQSIVTDLGKSMGQFNNQLSKLQADIQSKLNELYSNQNNFNLTYEQWLVLVNNIQRNQVQYQQGITLFNKGAQEFNVSLEEWRQQQYEWTVLKTDFKNLSAIYDELKKVYNVQAAKFAEQLEKMFNGDWSDIFYGPLRNFAIGLATTFSIMGAIALAVGIFYSIRYFCPGVCSGCCGGGGCCCGGSSYKRHHDD
uniref:Membrane protein Allo46 n=1 Tax=Cyprinid herpesvirus 2 TaxID=317878 RepID=A0A6H0QYE6_CYHV2